MPYAVSEVEIPKICLNPVRLINNSTNQKRLLVQDSRLWTRNPSDQATKATMLTVGEEPRCSPFTTPEISKQASGIPPRVGTLLGLQLSS